MKEDDPWPFDKSEALLEDLDTREKFAKFLYAFADDLRKDDEHRELILYGVMSTLADEILYHDAPSDEASWRYIADMLISAAVNT